MVDALWVKPNGLRIRNLLGAKVLATFLILRPAMINGAPELLVV